MHILSRWEVNKQRIIYIFALFHWEGNNQMFHVHYMVHLVCEHSYKCVVQMATNLYNIVVTLEWPTTNKAGNFDDASHLN